MNATKGKERYNYKGRYDKEIEDLHRVGVSAWKIYLHITAQYGHVITPPIVYRRVKSLREDTPGR